MWGAECQYDGLLAPAGFCTYHHPCCDRPPQGRTNAAGADDVENTARRGGAPTPAAGVSTLTRVEAAAALALAASHEQQQEIRPTAAAAAVIAMGP